MAYAYSFTGRNNKHYLQSTQSNKEITPILFSQWLLYINTYMYMYRVIYVCVLKIGITTTINF